MHMPEPHTSPIDSELAGIWGEPGNMLWVTISLDKCFYTKV